MARTTWSMMSFPTHNWATGITEETTRKTIVAVVRGGLVFQTIRNKGGTFRSARRRSRHVTGASADFGRGGWGGIKRWFAVQNGPRSAPFDTICLNLNRPPAVARAMYGRIRFDGNATVKTCL